MSGEKKYPMAEAVRAAYRAGEEDEAMEPRVLVGADGKPVGRIGDGDYAIFYDIRGEREIELTDSFTNPNFEHFKVAPIRTHWAIWRFVRRSAAGTRSHPGIGRPRITATSALVVSTTWSD